ncbi:uncharacterized protein METZ01_LOCUS181920 [marine metagenome]|uniref:Uncharacterized protein n=1 Tax=marine metagenome TaxID=408172 RepID=A0A382CSC8_9ZZZZ|tara:strand:+ start:151 stop:429 length:279 start_codon:yes stop_codon:yes gene_type:complete
MLTTTDMETMGSLVSKMSLEDISTFSDRMNLQRTFLGKDLMRSLVIGDKVSFTGRGGVLVEGTVEKIAIKNVSVNTDRGRWRVPASMLTKVA